MRMAADSIRRIHAGERLLCWRLCCCCCAVACAARCWLIDAFRIIVYERCLEWGQLQWRREADMAPSRAPFFCCWVYASTSMRLHVCGRCSYIFVGIGEELHAIAHEPLLYIANIKIDTPYTFRRDATLCGVFAVYMYILCGHLDFSSIVPSAKTSWVVTARITRKDIHYS